MLAYTFPLYVLGAFQVVLASMLLGPIQTARPVIALAKLTKQPVGTTIVGTLAVLLSIFMIPPLWEITDRGKRTLKGEGGALGDLRQREAEATGSLNLVLTGACLLLLFVLKKLSLVLAEREQLKISQQAMLSQVRNMRTEYDRLSSEGPAPASQTQQSGGKTTKQEELLVALKEEIAELQGKLQSAQKSQRTAEANVEALKTQTKGLGNEYDRLLAEHDAINKRLSSVDPTYSRNVPAGRKKDA